MEKLEKFLVKYIWLVILVLSIPAVWALFVPGFYGASDDLHVAWLFEMDRTLNLGQFPPRYVPDLSYQFGYPLFNFVFPLPFYLGEIFHRLGLNLVDSIKFVFLISVPLSMYWMYKLIKEFAPGLVSLAAAVLYVYTPYRATDLYVRGAIGEIVGFAFLPLITLSVIKLIKGGSVLESRKWIGIGSLAIGALILTHDIMAYMFFPLVGVLAILFLFAQKRKQVIIPITLVGTLGLLISLYFWLPAILDSKLMKYDTVFNFQDHFPTLKQLIVPYWGYGASVPGPYDGMSFFIGIFNWAGFLVGTLLLFWKWKKTDNLKKIILLWASGIFILSIVMMNYRSTPIWNITPELPYFQFPWRFLILTTFSSCIFFITIEKFKKAKLISLLLIIAVIAINAFQFRPQDFLGRTDSYYLNRYVPFPQVSEDYKKTQEEYLRLPKQTLTRPDKVYSPFFADQPITIEPIKNNPLDYEAKIGVTAQTNVGFNKYLFPGWYLVIDTILTNPNPGQPFGQINFSLTPGYHVVRVFYKETSFNLMLDLISLLSLVIAILLGTNSLWRLRRKNV